MMGIVRTCEIFDRTHGRHGFQFKTSFGDLSRRHCPSFLVNVTKRAESEWHNSARRRRNYPSTPQQEDQPQNRAPQVLTMPNKITLTLYTVHSQDHNRPLPRPRSSRTTILLHQPPSLPPAIHTTTTPPMASSITPITFHNKR
jgi:hypothetical protein